jgi:hypothetical protein
LGAGQVTLVRSAARIHLTDCHLEQQDGFNGPCGEERLTACIKFRRFDRNGHWLKEWPDVILKLPQPYGVAVLAYRVVKSNVEMLDLAQARPQI